MKTSTICILIIMALALGSYAYSGGPNVAINLGTADNFGVLAGSGITNASAATFINGDVGSSPTPSVTGILQSQVNGTLYLNPDPATAQAQTDLIVAYNQAAGAPCGTVLTGTDLGGLTLVPGVYCYSSSALLTGTLTLDGQGDPNAQWVFQIGSTLTTATNSTVSLINGANLCNVYWQIGSSATIQTGNTFVGIIMALTSITLDGGTLNGRALARNGAVTISAQETINGLPCNCTAFVSNPTAGTVTRVSFPMPFHPGHSIVTQTVIATGLTSAEGLACGSHRRLHVAQSGVFGGTRQIIRMDQNGANQTVMCDFATSPGLAASGGPEGLSFGPPSAKSQRLFFNTTLSSGFSNTGVWRMGASPIQVMQPGPSNEVGGATAFLTMGPFAGDLLALDEGDNKVVRVPSPFTAAQPGIDFITSLTGPVGLAVNSAGNVFVSNTDGTIAQFAPDGTSLGQFVNTGLHNMNIAFNHTGKSFVVATQEGPVVLVLADGTQETIGTVPGGDGVAICAH